MPQTRQTSPPARRTTYDPRASAAPQRPGGPGGYQGGRPGGRPGQRGPFGRPGMGGRMNVGPSRPKGPINLTEMAAHKKVIKIEENVSLQKLASMMSLKVTDVLLKLLGMGMPGVNINSTIDADTAKILASEFGWTVEDVAVSEEASIEAAMGVEEGGDVEQTTRPPIVTVMGHVDHGKTSLLDRIRKATVAAGEAGGITQHIGAYRVETPKGTIAFLDTPGHEAFTAMRARGAQVTDIVVLVVAADDGVMPQTREAISHAQSGKVPIIVAINKIDKPSSDQEKIKRELSNLGLQPEEWGGTTLFCPVSAHTGQGIEQLLEAISLQAEVLELRAAPKRKASGVVVEALLDRGRGPVARVMVQDGTLRVGDIMLAGPAFGKVRAMTDEHGRALAAAGPSTPVEVLGLNEVPSAGDQVHSVKDAKTAEEIAETRKKKANKSLLGVDAGVSLEALKERLSKGEQLELKLIIKGDVQGSVEAVVSALTKLNTPKVKVTVVHAAVGAITEGDVNLAIAAKAIIVGFNVRPAGKATSLAEGGGVEIRLYTIIYNAVDDIKAAMEGLLPTTKVEKALGAADVRQVFKITKVGAVAGCYVTTGLVRRGADARLVRDSIVVWTGKIQSLRRIKDDVKEVAEGTECGITLENYQDLKENDVIEAFEIEEVKQKLS
ncbi:MAG: translation initiation factor IF-2 [Polyangiaceae bacterium]|nr:translation initiation factor IF-2 [Polyangiaceae bacterium]